MKTETVTHESIKLNISEATVLMSLERDRLRREALQAKEPDFERQVLRELTYPDLVAATTGAEGIAWPLDFESFVELPDPLLEAWEEAVYRLNPHWLPGQAGSDDIVLRMITRQRKLKENKETIPELPEQVQLYQPETAWQLWQLLELCDWRWPPDVLLRQPELILLDLLTLGDLAHTVERSINGK